MASRFETVNEEYIEELRDESKIENTNTEWLKNAFTEWANERNLQANLEEYENNVLNQLLFQLSFQKFSNFALYVINK